VKEKTKPINIFESDYNIMTHIAQLEGLVYPIGHTHAGKMNPAETMKYIIKRLE
jgi:hypothetical protein